MLYLYSTEQFRKYSHTYSFISHSHTLMSNIITIQKRKKKKTELLNVKRGVYIHTVYKICLYSDF